MEKLLKDTLKSRKEYINKKITSFSESELKEIFTKYDEILSKGFIEYKELKNKDENKFKFQRFRTSCIFYEYQKLYRNM